MMRPVKNIFLGLVCLLGLAACDFGVVDQGRTVAVDPDAATVTIVRDIKHDQLNPEYTGAIVTYKMPAEPHECGPAPEAGGRLKVDVPNSKVIIYHPESKSLETVSVKIVDIQRHIAKDNPLVKDKTFPVVDRATRSVTVYRAPHKMLLTFVYPEELADLPDVTWKSGDDVRVYYKENVAHQALRFMNISKTNIYKK